MQRSVTGLKDQQLQVTTDLKPGVFKPGTYRWWARDTTSFVAESRQKVSPTQWVPLIAPQQHLLCPPSCTSNNRFVYRFLLF